jgi:hypothetical protein
MSPTDVYLAHIHAAFMALAEAHRLNAEGQPFHGALAAVQNLNIAAEEAMKASRVLRFYCERASDEGGQS